MSRQSLKSVREYDSSNVQRKKELERSYKKELNSEEVKSDMSSELQDKKFL